MATLLVTQRNGSDHPNPPGHVERQARIDAIALALSQPSFSDLVRRDAPIGDLMLAELVHTRRHMDVLRRYRPAEGMSRIDPDTFMSPGSLDVVGTAIGAGMAALDAVVMGEVANAFCLVRPPGHHAEIERAMGFCLVNIIAVVAREAQRKYGAERVAIVDFDVHHGNGTQDVFKADPTVLYCSSHQSALYPHTGAVTETGVGNIVNAPLRRGTDGEAMREAYLDRILPAVDAFAPDLILVSAGFDADARDPIAGLNWLPDDYAWLTGRVMDIADLRCEGRVVSLMEGGYDLTALGEDAAAHVGTLHGILPR